MSVPADETSESVAAARRGDKYRIGRLITWFEDERVDAPRRRRDVMALLEDAPVGRVVGITGAPGVGKSTLVGALALNLCGDPAARVAVVAVDPSSPISGGSLLGDRTRVHFPPGEARLFFRSQPSAGEHGGLARSTFHVCRLLSRLFTTVIVETLGVGQGEISVASIADHTVLVLQPHGGDHVQFMKAGIMEIPNSFVVSKSDLGGAALATANGLRASLALARLERRPVHVTSARTGEGIAALADAVIAIQPGGLTTREPAYFERWVASEHGRDGLRRLGTLAPSAAAFLAMHGGLDGAQLAFG